MTAQGSDGNGRFGAERADGALSEGEQGGFGRRRLGRGSKLEGVAGNCKERIHNFWMLEKGDRYKILAGSRVQLAFLYLDTSPPDMA